jgi:hypothetical protein
MGYRKGAFWANFCFFAYVNYIWSNLELTIRLSADGCIIYRKIKNESDMGNLQIDLDRLGEWAIENMMQKIKV